MSKSIEERAIKYADGHAPCYERCGRWTSCKDKCYEWNSLHLRYSTIANEQKAIDDEEYRKERENQWILVSEHTMPRCYRIDDEKRSKQLLFKTRDGLTHFGILLYYPTGEWCCEDGSLDEDIPASSGEVTHWHPLPDDKAEFEE